MEQIEEVEIGMEQAKKHIAKADALQKLFKNADFQEVITKGYLEQEAIRLVLFKADPSAADPQMQESVEDGITSIGNLNQYFTTVRTLGNMAAKSLAEYQELHTELTVEAL